MKHQTVSVKSEIAKTVRVEFPLYRVFTEGDAGCLDWYAEFWKIESKHKITIIKESLIEMSVITYNDPEEDNFYEFVTEDMLNEKEGWERLPESSYDHAFNRLIDKVTNA